MALHPECEAFLAPGADAPVRMYDAITAEFDVLRDDGIIARTHFADAIKELLPQ